MLCVGYYPDVEGSLQEKYFMMLNTLYTLQQAFSEEAQIATHTPIWVPITIVVLILLLFLWGMTRGNVKDENLPHIDEAENHKVPRR